jgi:hypothetical protein
MMKTLRLAGAVVAVAALGALTFAAVGVAAPPSSNAAPVSVPIDISNATGSFVGSLNITNFVAQNGAVSLVGTLTGTLTNALTGVTTTITQDVVLPLLSATGSCTILHLVVGPIDLNLLGLMLHTDQIVVDLSAQAGPGNLLGNVLCGVSHLLDSNAAATAIANILNQVLGLI